MIYYPLTTLVMAGVRDILIVTGSEDHHQFRRLLGDGSQLGLNLEYRVQERPEGIAQALVLGKDFIADESVALVLGDNLFHGADLESRLRQNVNPIGARIFAYPVADPTSYGVVEFDKDGTALSIEEKPAKPRSRYAVPGLYFYDSRVADIAASLSPSSRGELEITAVNETYLLLGQLKVTALDRGTTWLDAGTFASMVCASEYVRVVEERQGMKVGCVEEAVWRCGLIDNDQLQKLSRPLLASGYGRYLLDLLEEKEPLPL